MQTDGDASRSLDSCPVCNYSLRGLPARHRCPECGFEYDEHTRAWRPRSYWKFAGFTFLCCAVGFLQAWDAFSDGHRTKGLICASILAAVIAITIYIYRRRPFLAVGPGGVFVKTGSSVVDHLRWETILDVSVHKGGERRFTFIRTIDGRNTEVGAVLRGMNEAYELREVVAAGLKRYAGMEGEDGAGGPGE